jgi:phage-related protein (TIGR01555 family)
MPATPPNRLTGQKGGMGYFADSLTNIMSGAGTTADRRTYDHYTMNFLGQVQVETAYRSSWLVRKVHDLPPTDMTRAWRDWQADDDKIKKLKAEEKRLGLRAKCKRALTLARLHGGGAIFLGYGDADTSKPAPTTVAAGGLKYITVLSRYQLSYREIDADVTSEFFGQPTMWTMASASKGQLDIHPSRIVPFVGQPKPEGALVIDGDQFWGDPLLQSLWDGLKNADLAQASVAALLDEASIDVISIPDLMGAYGATEEYERQFLRRLSLAKIAKSSHRALIIDAKETWAQRTTSFTALPDTIRLYLQIASGAADIPATRLLGQAPVGMNATGDGDMDNYLMMLEGKQQDDLQPVLDRIDAGLIPSALGSKPDDVTWTFAPLKTESEAVLATIELQRAQTVVAFAGTGLIPADALSTDTTNRMIESGQWPGLQDALDESKMEMEAGPADPDAEPDPSALTVDPKTGKPIPAPAVKPAAEPVPAKKPAPKKPAPKVKP